MTPEQAYRQVRSAVARGELSKPATCSKCGRDPGRGSDGRSLIQAHHFKGYDFPLDVEWLCSSCHVNETDFPHPRRAPLFERSNGFCKLTDNQVSEIRSSSLSNKELGRRFGVNHEYVRQIRRGQYRNRAALAAAEKPTQPNPQGEDHAR